MQGLSLKVLHFAGSAVQGEAFRVLQGSTPIKASRI